MAINLKKIQAAFLASGYLETLEKNKEPPINLSMAGRVLFDTIADFQEQIKIEIEAANMTAGGGLEDTIDSVFEADQNHLNSKVLMADYFDYPNQGVKGVKNKSKAAGSDYSFKNLYIGASMLAAMKEYVNSGKAKIANDAIFKQKEAGTAKNTDLATQKAYTLGVMIKAGGIKPRHYYDKAFERAFKGFGENIAEAHGTQMAITIKNQFNRNGNNNK